MFLVLVFLMIFPSVICEYRLSICNNASTYTEGSAYSTNLNRVINDLSRNAPQSSGFNTSAHGQSPNEAYGLLQCIGDISAAKCSNCSMEANNTIQELCANDIGGLVWMDDCFLRYDNSNFISTLDTNFFLLANTRKVTSNMQDFISATSTLLSNLSEQAYIPANKLLAVGSESYSTSNKVYGLVQCLRDLSVKDCRSCLFQAREALKHWSSSYQGAQAMSGSCTVRYEIYPFLNPGEPSPSPAKAYTMTCSVGLSAKDCTSCFDKATQMLEQCCSSKESGQVTLGDCTVGYSMNKTSDLRPLSAPDASSPPPSTPPTSTPSPPQVDHGRANPASQAKSS